MSTRANLEKMRVDMDMDTLNLYNLPTELLVLIRDRLKTIKCKAAFYGTCTFFRILSTRDEDYRDLTIGLQEVSTGWSRVARILLGDFASRGNRVYVDHMIEVMKKKLTCDYGNIMQDVFRGAIRGGQFELIQYYMSKGKTLHPLALSEASALGNLQLVEYFVSLCGFDLNVTMHDAAKGGHIEVVKFLVKKGATSLDSGMAGAAGGGHMETDKMVRDNGSIVLVSGDAVCRRSET
jgi:hypothetical protein